MPASIIAATKEHLRNDSQDRLATQNNNIPASLLQDYNTGFASHEPPEAEQAHTSSHWLSRTTMQPYNHSEITGYT